MKKEVRNIGSVNLTRRQILSMPSVLAVAGKPRQSGATQAKVKVAAITTVYFYHSHSDWIIGKLVSSYPYYGKEYTPRVKVVSMYIDQFPDNDLGRGIALEHGIPLYTNVRDTLTMGTNDLAVEGVIFIGEHGNYHWNLKGQKLYPRWYFFNQIIDTFARTGKSVPIFNDKHFSVEWNETKWMYDRSRDMVFPMMAGSSLPLVYRSPALELELDTPIIHGVALGFGGKESYGFHSLEVLQCMMERRKGGETGLAAVQCIEGPYVWKWTERNPWAGKLLEETLSRVAHSASAPQDMVRNPILFILDYRDGTKAAVYTLNGYGLRSWAFAADIRGKSDPVSTEFWFNFLNGPSHASVNFVYHIEELMVTKRESFPAERTLYTSGALSALMNSNWQNGKHIPRGRVLETQYLDISYQSHEKSLYNKAPRPKEGE